MDCTVDGMVACWPLGLGPVGIAFFTWDIGMKQGNLPLLGVLSYAAPLISTLLLLAQVWPRPAGACCCPAWPSSAERPWRRGLAETGLEPPTNLVEHPSQGAPTQTVP
jgi:hypothetical protein